MRPVMELKVELLTGTSIEQAVEQALNMLVILPMLAYVKFNFNGLEVCVNRNSKLDNLTERLMKAYAYEQTHKHWIV